jgi:hypothetical protein
MSSQSKGNQGSPSQRATRGIKVKIKAVTMPHPDLSMKTGAVGRQVILTSKGK